MKSTAAPKHLSAEAARLWDRLRAEFAITDAGGQLLLRSALEAFDRLQQAREILAAEGSIMRDRFGQAKAHPAAALERDARGQMHGALRLLQLAPGVVE